MSEYQPWPLLCSKEGHLQGRNPRMAGLGDLPLEHVQDVSVTAMSFLHHCCSPWVLQQILCDILMMCRNFKISNLIFLQPESLEEKKVDTFYDSSFYLHN